MGPARGRGEGGGALGKEGGQQELKEEERNKRGGRGRQSLLEWVRPTWLFPCNCGWGLDRILTLGIDFPEVGSTSITQAGLLHLAVFLPYLAS